MNKKLLIILFLFCSLSVLASERIEINTAPLEELDKITEIGPALAQRIIDARPFISINDLVKVKGIGEKTLQKIKDQGLAYVKNDIGLTNDTVTEKTTTTEPIIATNEQVKEASTRTTGQTYPTGVIINEILPSPEGADEENEYIELYNTNNFEINLSGWKIKDVDGTKTTYSFKDGTKISANGYLLLKRPETKIILNNSKDGLNLLWPDNKVADSLVYNTALPSQSYNKTSSTWQWSTSLTPGEKNIILTNNVENSKSLPNPQKSGNSNKIEAGLAAIKQGIGKKDVKNDNPWFLLFVAVIITILSALFVLFIKLKLNNHVRT